MIHGQRRGILAAGNFIVDRIKSVDAYPQENMLATISSEARSNGGGPYNILKDLAAMGADYPLLAGGCIGADAEGDWIVADCLAAGIDPGALERDATENTSYTDVMSARTSGRRTFFHRRGANANFTGDSLDFERVPARNFHLAYLMLLDRLDGFASDGKTFANRLLGRARAHGLITSADLVSTAHPEFREIVLGALPEIDHLLINEVEAGQVLGSVVDPADAVGMARAARALLAGGVRRAVVMHSEYGAVHAAAAGADSFHGALVLEAEEIIGANGAGDAFAAGYLHGVHEQLPVKDSLELAVCAAALCLGDPSPSGGLRSVAHCLAFGRARKRVRFAD